MTQFDAENFCRSRDIPDRFPHLFTQHQWEWLLRNRHSNGLDRAIKKLGSRYFVNVSTLLELLEESSG